VSAVSSLKSAGAGSISWWVKREVDSGNPGTPHGAPAPDGASEPAARAEHGTLGKPRVMGPQVAAMAYTACGSHCLRLLPSPWRALRLGSRPAPRPDSHHAPRLGSRHAPRLGSRPALRLGQRPRPHVGPHPARHSARRPRPCRTPCPSRHSAGRPRPCGTPRPSEHFTLCLCLCPAPHPALHLGAHSTRHSSPHPALRPGLEGAGWLGGRCAACCGLRAALRLRSQPSVHLTGLGRLDVPWV
jgi:hypothetical protein